MNFNCHIWGKCAHICCTYSANCKYVLHIMHKFPLDFKLKWQVNSVYHGLMVMVVLGYGLSGHPQGHILLQKGYGVKFKSSEHT